MIVRFFDKNRKLIGNLDEPGLPDVGQVVQVNGSYWVVVERENNETIVDPFSLKRHAS